MNIHTRKMIFWGLMAAAAAACGPQQHHSDERWTTVAGLLPDSSRVPLEEARRMVANYGPHAGFVDRDGQQLPNTRVAWVSLDYLQGMLDMLQAEGGDGIHIYLAAYDSTYTDTEAHVPPREWWGYNTVLFTSTRDSVANGRHYHRDYFYTGSREPNSIWRNGFIVTMEPMNRVGICPPPTEDCREWGALLLEE